MGFGRVVSVAYVGEAVSGRGGKTVTLWMWVRAWVLELVWKVGLGRRTNVCMGGFGVGCISRKTEKWEDKHTGRSAARKQPGKL